MIVKKTNGIWHIVNVPTRHLIGRTMVNLLKMEHLWNEYGYYDVTVPSITNDQELIDLTDNDVTVNGEQRFRDLSQAEIDERNAKELEQQNLSDVQRQLSKANGIALDMFVFIRKDNVGLTDNQKNVLKGLAVKLYQGDVEGAIEDFNAISRPTNANKMQKVYDTLEIKFNQL